VEPFLTIAQVAETFAVSARTVRNWIRDGKITAYRIAGRIIRIDPRSLDLLYEPVQYQGR
jgi:excisionase family DNA binding protein